VPTKDFNLKDVRLDGPVAVYRQITDEVRNLIRSGQLPAGNKLPPTSELAQLWNVQVATV